MFMDGCVLLFSFLFFSFLFFFHFFLLFFSVDI